MKFFVTTASETTEGLINFDLTPVIPDQYRGYAIIEVTTIEELMVLCDKWGCPIILDHKTKKDDLYGERKMVDATGKKHRDYWTLKIYSGYIE